MPRVGDYITCNYIIDQCNNLFFINIEPVSDVTIKSKSRPKTSKNTKASASKTSASASKTSASASARCSSKASKSHKTTRYL